MPLNSPNKPKPMPTWRSERANVAALKAIIKYVDCDPYGCFCCGASLPAECSEVRNKYDVLKHEMNCPLWQCLRAVAGEKDADGELVKRLEEALQNMMNRCRLCGGKGVVQNFPSVSNRLCMHCGEAYLLLNLAPAKPACCDGSGWTEDATTIHFCPTCNADGSKPRPEAKRLPGSGHMKLTVDEQIQQLRDAGGDAWDEVADPQAFLDLPNPAAKPSPDRVRCQSNIVAPWECLSHAKGDQACWMQQAVNEPDTKPAASEPPICKRLRQLKTVARRAGSVIITERELSSAISLIEELDNAEAEAEARQQRQWNGGS